MRIISKKKLKKKVEKKAEKLAEKMMAQRMSSYGVGVFDASGKTLLFSSFESLKDTIDYAGGCYKLLLVNGEKVVFSDCVGRP